jgi:hypothetical protein
MMPSISARLKQGRGAQQHPHNVPTLFIVGGKLRQIARFGKRTTGGVIKQFLKTFPFFC